MSLFAGSLGNFGAKARAVGLTTLTTSSMPSKPTDFGFFNVLSIESQNEPDPAHFRDFCQKCESEQLWWCIIGRKGSFVLECSPQLAKRGQYITTALMDVCLVHKPRRRFSSSAIAHLGRRCVGRVASTSLHHEHSGKGGSRSAPQPLIDTIVHLICVTLLQKRAKVQPHRTSLTTHSTFHVTPTASDQKFFQSHGDHQSSHLRPACL